MLPYVLDSSAVLTALFNEPGAARVKATTPLSVADSWIAALALTRGATLVHKDPEYNQLAALLVERLPYKARQA